MTFIQGAKCKFAIHDVGYVMCDVILLAIPVNQQMSAQDNNNTVYIKMFVLAGMHRFQTILQWIQILYFFVVDISELL